MRFRPASTLVVAAALIFLLPLSSSSQNEKQVSATPTLKMLSAALTKMEGDLKSVSAAAKEQVAKLVARQKTELKTAESQCGRQPSVSQQELGACLAPFFKTGADLIDTLKPAPDQFHAAQYSPDPSYCANHCYNTCGYNSLGEKVCWYSCYRCCGRGGC